MEIIVEHPFYGNGPETYESILKSLSEERVFNIEKQEDGTFEIREGCDDYFSVDLTREQLVALGEEIIAFAAQ